MDGSRFDLLTRALSRRAGLRGAVAGLAAAAGLVSTAGAKPAAESCLTNGQRCGKGSGKKGKPCAKCCSRHAVTQPNGRKRCACKPAGMSARNAAQCCSGERSAGGFCGACDPGLTQCPAGCVDTGSDVANCGACGNACAAEHSCVEGACTCTATSCPDGCCDGASCVAAGAACAAADTVCVAGDGCTPCGGLGQPCCAGDSCPDGCCDTAAGVCGACVFLTAGEYQGMSIGGLTQADAFCNTSASGHLPGTYMAWLSSPDGSPSTRFVRSDVAYVRPDGVRVADDWDDLVDGSLLAPIAVTQSGDPPHDNRNAWTGTASDGTAIAGKTCGNWDTRMIQGGGYGDDAATDGEWTAASSQNCHDWYWRLYCFQQPEA